MNDFDKFAHAAWQRSQHERGLECDACPHESIAETEEQLETLLLEPEIY